MKSLIFTLLIIINTTLLHAQCSQPISVSDFQILKSQIVTNQRGNQGFQRAMDATRTTCMTTFQAKEIAFLLGTEKERFDFLSKAYEKIVDKENFTDVMDVFRSFSLAFKLYHMTMSNGYVENTPTNILTPSGRNCNIVMSNQEFSVKRSQYQMQANDRLKASFILSSLQGKCFLTQQMMDLCNMISDDNIKLDVLKRMSSSIFDIENYAQAGQILTPTNKSNFIFYLNTLNQSSPSTLSQNQMGNCTMSLQEFSDFVKSVQKMSFDTDKTEQVKTTLGSRCLTSAQVKELLLVSSYESSRVQMAKDMYANCIDKNNYFKVNESFKMSSSISELNTYINSFK